VDATREYQRMAPQKLKDETLESILWNKVPIELQEELKEMPDNASSVAEIPPCRSCCGSGEVRD